MNVAAHYHLSFNSKTLSNGLVVPFIKVIPTNGESINYEIASFIEVNGPKYAQVLIDEATSLANSTIYGGEVLNGAHEVEIVTIIPSPPRVVFDTGGQPVIIPLADFISIVQEWKAFLASLPAQHSLADR